MIQEVGRDLRLGPKVQITEVETTPMVSMSKSEQETLIGEVPNQVPLHKMRRLVRAGVGTVLVILVLVALASVIDPQNFLRIAAKRVEVSKHNLNQWVAFVTHQQAVPEKIIAKVAKEVETKWKQQRVLIQHGSTISKIVSDVYGANSLLALDIIKEFNPQIKNLNWVFPGQELLLPPLTHETMLRKQPDGSYRLIVASFSSLTEADNYTRLLGSAGYQVVVTPKRISDDLLLHRVEIDGLKNIEEANQIWDTGLKNQWLAFLGNPTSRDR